MTRPRPRQPLEAVVEVAAHVLSAEAASIALLEPDTSELVIKHATARSQRRPGTPAYRSGEGEASGQSMAVWDAQSDTRPRLPCRSALGPLTRKRVGSRGEVEDSPAYLHALQLAQLVQEIGQHGEPERDHCEAFLRSFAEYLRSRPQLAQRLWSAEDLADASLVIGPHH